MSRVGPIRQILVFFTFLAAMGGCGSQPKDVQTRPRDGASIGVTLPTLSGPVFSGLAEAIKEAAARSDQTIDIRSAEGQADKQAAQIDGFVAQGAEAILVWPCDCAAIGQSIKKANAADVAVFTLGAACENLKSELVGHLGADEHRGGRDAARAIVRVLGEYGEVAALSHPEDQIAVVRMEAFQEQIALYREVYLLEVVSGEGDFEKSRTVTRRLLAFHPNLAAIFAVNGPSALGAAAAVEEAGRTGKVRIMAFGASRDVRLAVKQDRLIGTIIWDPRLIGEKAVKAAVACLTGEYLGSNLLVRCRVYLKPDAEIDTTFLDEAAPDPQ
jgi:ribose transport system substrate-binding protein